ncbi:Uma2 family endonuclease [Nocardioides sp. NPDC047086]|uniref:Uma2 family endonuclease n=1 Tax=Nocardioides sp. NPDC047086 TaxID=3154810 RepID=UPI003406F83B
MTEIAAIASSYDEGTIIVPMSWEEYDSLDFDDDLHGAEYIDGVLVAPPGFPDRGHQKAIAYLQSVLEDVIGPGEDVISGFGWHPAGGTEEFGPDVMVHPLPTDPKRFIGVPVLCVEVTSSNRQNDLVKKRDKYATAGLPDYWIVDRQAGILRCYKLKDSFLIESEEHVRTGKDAQMVTVHFADRAAEVDLGRLFT